MRYRVLGPVRVDNDGEAIPLGGPQQRLVLALLIAADGRVLSSSGLIEAVWGEEAPPTAKKTIQGYISHLRAQLGDALATQGSGYSLDTRGAVDSAEFEHLRRRGQELLEIDPMAAASAFREALALWDGPAFADLSDQLALTPDITRLEDLRVSVLGDRVDADLACGGHSGLIGELDGLTQEYPLHERFRGQHMLALYRAGRQVEALRAFERTRRFLSEEMGLDPSAELRDLEQKILDGDTSLDLEGEGDHAGRPAVRGYELREVVATSESVETYRAYQRSVGREVTVQVLGPGVADDPQFIANFVTDTQRVAALEHPHIGFVYDTWREPGRAYQVSRWFPGGSLAGRLTAEKLSAPKALRILDQIGGALAYAHRQGVPHGQVTASTVMFDDEGNAYLRDFLVGRNGDATPDDDRREFAALAHVLIAGTSPRAIDGELAPALSISEAPEAVTSVFEVAFESEGGYARVEDFLRALHQAMGAEAVAPDSANAMSMSAVRNPYKGLRAFQEADADDFFGRDDLIGRLVSRLDSNRLVAVVGPSGSGKSSVVKAGLSARIRSRQGGPIRLQTEMFPGAFPFEELEGALLRVGVNRNSLISELLSDERGLLRVLKQIMPADDAELLLIIDQFEELFSMATDRKVTQLFLHSLLTAVSDPRSRLRVVVTMRADFYDRPLQHPEFGTLLETGLVSVTIPDQVGLAAAVAQPALAVGLDFEPGLVDRIVRDLDDQPGGLPLLQYAMTELVEQRTGDVLTFAAYEAIGGVYGALGKRAEDLFDSLPPGGQRSIRQAFLRMVTVDEGAKDLRRRVTRAELAATDVDDAALSEALQLFGAHRLLTFDRDPTTRANTVEVAHEALTREWGRLEGWIHEERDDLVVRRRVDEALTEWQDSGEDPSYLPSGSRLAQFQDWSGSTTLALSSHERGFLDAGAERELDLEHKAANRRKRLLAGLFAASILLAIVAGFALIQKSNADEAAAAAETSAIAAGASESAARATAYEAETGRLGATAVIQVESNPVLGLLLAAETYNRDDGVASLGALQQTMTRTGPLLSRFGAGALQVEWAGEKIVAFAPSGLSVYDAEALVETLSVELPVLLRPAYFPRFSLPETDGGGAPFAVTDSGAKAAVGLEGERVSLVDLSSAEVETIDVNAQVSSLRFSPDSSILAVGDVTGLVTFYSADDLDPVLEIEPVDSRASFAEFEEFTSWAEGGFDSYEEMVFWVGAIEFDEAGDQVAIAQGPRVSVFSAITGTQLMPTSILQSQNTFPTNPEHIVFAGDELWTRGLKTFTRIDRTSGELIARIGLYGLSTEGSGRGFVPTGSDRALFVEENAVHELELLETTPGAEEVPQAKVVNTVRLPITVQEGFDVSPNGDRWVVAGANSLMVGATHSGGPLATAVPTEIATPGLSINGAGDLVAVTDAQRGEVWDLSGGTIRRLEVPTRLRDEIMGPQPDDIGPAGSLWVVTTPAPHGETNLEICTAGGNVCESYAGRDFGTPRGRTLDNQVPADDGPDGKLLANTPPSDNTVIIIKERQSGQTVRELRTDDASATLDWVPDGSRLYRTTVDGRLEGWRTSDWSRIETIGFGENPEEAYVIRHSPDGRRVATIDGSGVVAVRDTETGRVVKAFSAGQNLPLGSIQFLKSPWFSPRGDRLITTFDGSVRLWDVESGAQIGGRFPNDEQSAAGGAEGPELQLATSVDGNIFVWNLDTSTWYDTACKAAGRNMTPAEWEQFGPRDTEYRSTCPQYPIES